MGVVQVLLDQHAALRLKLVRGEGAWTLEAGAVGSVLAEDCFRRVEVKGLKGGALAACLRRERGGGRPDSGAGGGADGAGGGLRRARGRRGGCCW